MNAQTPKAVIQGSLVDAKNINQHKCVRLSIDVPAELGAQVVKAFGWPTMAEPVHVAVARLIPEAQQETEAPPKERRRLKELAPATQAALVCQEPRFWAYLREERIYECHDEEDAAVFVREFCEVKSRSEIRPGTHAENRWQFLASDYLGWKIAEQAGA